MCCTDLSIKFLFFLNKLHSVVQLFNCIQLFFAVGYSNNPKEKDQKGLNQDILEAIRYYYVDLRFFLQKVGLVLHELPITHGKEPHSGPITNVEIDFLGIYFEMTLSSKRCDLVI